MKGVPFSTSNSFTLTAPCTSSLSSLAEASGESFALESICTPTNPSLLPPTQTSPGTVASVAQPNGSTLGATTQTFTWNTVSGAVKYALYVRNLDTDVLEVNNENVTGTSFTSNVLKAGAKYKWNVRAIDSTGKGGWISDGLWFAVQSGIVEAPVDNGDIRILVVNENDQPLAGVSVSIACYSTGTNVCPPNSLQEVAGITGSDGFATFSKKYYPYSSISYGVLGTTAVTSFEADVQRFAYVIKNSSTGKIDTYDAYNITDSSTQINQFVEGMYDTASIQFSIEGLAVGATAEGVSLATQKIKQQIITKYGTTIAGKFVVKAIPGIGTVYLVGVSAYVVYDNYDDGKRCLGFSGNSILDPEIQLYRAPAYFCGKLTTKGALTLAGVGVSRLAGFGYAKYIAPKWGISIIGKYLLPNNVITTIDYIKSKNFTATLPNYSGNSTYNNTTNLLPTKPSGYYKEWDTAAGTEGRQSGERLVSGADGEIYFTADHYTTFKLIQE